MLTRQADLDAIWAVWDVPAEGVLAAARGNGRDDLAVTTIDLGQNVAIEMAKGGTISGLGAQRPYDQGVAEAMLAGYALLDKKAPEYVAVNALAVRPSNLADAWQDVYHQALPPKVVEAQQ
jgi:ribose transport system substrate-binding protein